MSTQLAFPAKYPGRCSDCREDFPAGTEIERTADGTYQHADGCPEPQPTELDLRPGEQPCGSCWTVHRGECW
jgi:hypothetical protein